MQEPNVQQEMMQDAKPLVSIVILNWNGGTEVIAGVEHVLRQTYENLELIVVDNGSTDGSREVIEKRFPQLHIIENKRNLGFATGMNQGIEATSGKYVLLLNQDAWIREDYIANATKLVQKNPSSPIGMVAGQIYKLIDEQKTMQQLAQGFLLRKGFRLALDPNFTTEHWTWSPSWCSPFLAKEMLDEIKAVSGHYFDDRYFVYGEDIDITFRAHLLGWKCLFSPTLVTWHSLSSATEGRVRVWEKPPAIRIHALRNRYLSIIKDIPASLLLWLLPSLLLVEVGSWLFFALRSPSTILYLLRAYTEVICWLPQTLRLRRRIQAHRKVEGNYFKQFFVGV